MNYMTSLSLLRMFGAGALLLSASLAHAQYAWVDEKGVRHYSDRPPPPSTPPAKSLKGPQQRRAASLEGAAPAAAPATTAAEPAKASGQPALAEREADFRKRALERTKEESKAAAEDQRKQAQAENCKSTREYKAQLESGVRVGTMDAKGERGFMSDEDRAKVLTRTNKALASCG